jgi:hypothetical protein
MTRKRHDLRLGTFSLGMLVVSSTTACAESEPRRVPPATDAGGSSANLDAAVRPMDGGFGGDAGGPETACVRCPSIGVERRCLHFDLSAQPRYEETRQQWLAECPAPDSGRRLPQVSEARCTSNGLRYVEKHYGLGIQRRYFDADGGFVNTQTTTDVFDAVCSGKFSWPVRTDCEAKSDTKILCGML